MNLPPQRVFEEKQTYNVVNANDRTDRFTITAGSDFEAKVKFVDMYGYVIQEHNGKFPLLDVETGEIARHVLNVSTIEEAYDRVLQELGYTITEGDFFGKEVMGSGFSVDTEE